MSLVGHTHTFLVTPHLSTTKTPLASPSCSFTTESEESKKIPKYQKMKLQKTYQNTLVPKYQSTKRWNYKTVPILFLRQSRVGENDEKTKTSFSPLPILFHPKLFLGQLKWTESTRIHDTSCWPLDQPRNQIQRLDIAKTKTLDKARTKQEQTGTPWFEVLSSKDYSVDLFHFHPSGNCSTVQDFANCSTLQETQAFSRIFSTLVSAPSLQMSPSGSVVEAKTDRPQMFRLAL